MTNAYKIKCAIKNCVFKIKQHLKENIVYKFIMFIGTASKLFNQKFDLARFKAD